MDDACHDCVQVGEDPPMFPEGRSPYCLWHIQERRRWRERSNQRLSRARRTGRPTPDVEPYKPEPLNDVMSLNRDRRIPNEDVDYLDGIAGEVRRHRVTIDNVLATGRLPPRDAVANLTREVGVLLQELNSLLWPESVEPTQASARPKPQPRED